LGLFLGVAAKNSSTALFIILPVLLMIYLVSMILCCICCVRKKMISQTKDRHKDFEKILAELNETRYSTMGARWSISFDMNQLYLFHRSNMPN
jgi:hypothetical protein